MVLLTIIGAIISNGKQEVISQNTSDFMMMALGEGYKESEDKLIYRNDTTELVTILCL